MELFVVIIPIYALMQLAVFGLKGRWRAAGFVPLFIVLATGIYQALIGSGLVVLYVGVMSFYGIIFLILLFSARMAFRLRVSTEAPYDGEEKNGSKGRINKWRDHK